MDCLIFVLYRIYFILVFFSQVLFAQQNLVPNWSFENLSSCPNGGYGNINYANPWFQPFSPQSSPGGSTDIFHNCITNASFHVPYNALNFQPSKMGIGYAALSPLTTSLPDSNRFREYLEVQLLDTMSFGRKYCAKYFVSNIGLFNCALVIDKIECYFSSDSLISFSGNSDRIPVTPSIIYSGSPIIDTLTWTEIKGIYISNGQEKFMTIGNFRPYFELNVDTFCTGGGSVWSAYYFIDNVSVYEIPEVYAGKDTTFCPWQSTVLGPSSVRSDVQYRWSPAYGLNDSTLANPIAMPLQTTTYTLTVIDTNQWACYPQMYDTVTITVSGCVGISENSLSLLRVKVFPNPFSGSTTFAFEKDGTYRIRIFDITGKEVESKTIVGKNYTFDSNCVSYGMYFYEVENDTNKRSIGKIIIK